MKSFKRLSVLLCLTLLISIIGVGCQKKEDDNGEKEVSNNVQKENSEETNKKPVTLTFVLWNEVGYEYLTGINSISEAYKKDHPNVTIKVEQIQPTEYDNTMKIRNSANQLPDVFLVRASNLLTYKEIMVPLNELEAAKNNNVALDYALDGNVIGIPQGAFNEFVYYRKDIFEKYDLEIPRTWDEVISTANTIKEKGEYIPLLLGGKDSWTTYPFNEFMPLLQANDGKYWSDMASKDEPFSKGEPFYESYTKIKSLYDAKVCGNDPLGYGWDQQKAMFLAGEGAMLAAGQWFAQEYDTMGGNKDEDLGIFVLPVRESKDEPLNVITTAEGFMGTPKTSKNIEEAKEFINWFYMSDYYKEYVDYTQQLSTMKDVSADIPFFNQAFEGVDLEYVVYDAGNEEYKKIADTISFDVKGMGQDMLAGIDFEKMMSDMNKKWKDARNK
ncbi:ABC transporter substrate-binding protein [Vallitalea maricola]|uniref:Uncharacterized protein n=1 Tax=Vallitalea maricola TaxID=3074433 RepID=A0ACB5UP54_9FIRM|nr:hypothetical protein AN2V17_29070 [Vallitalea sp. AN17-2]